MRGARLEAYPKLQLIGMNFFGDPFATSAGWTLENEIGRLWSRWMAYLEAHPGEFAAVGQPDEALEVHIWGPAAEETGDFDVFVGVEVASLDAVPLPLVAKVLPATTYAIFTLEGDEIVGDWARIIYQDWIPAQGYRSAHDYMIQWYDARFGGLDHLNGSELDIYVPVAPVVG